MSKRETITIQIFKDGDWVSAATFEAKESSHEYGGYLEYDPDYAIEHINNDNRSRQVGLRYPVGFDYFAEERWPAFLLDILPSGAGRRVWARRLQITDSYAADWQLLRHGAGNAPGNLRVLEAVIPSPEQPHHGFSKTEIIQKNADFIEYAESRGAMVAAASDVAGDAPKFLLVQDKNGRWHPDGALRDGDIAACWLVKFPRGKSGRDLAVLRNEAVYYEVARWFGVRTGQKLDFCENSLFIPRFDRLPGTPFTRYGLETLASAAGIAAYGVRADHLALCRTIMEFATDPVTEVKEYLRREVLNTALRNTDNHARNSAFLKLSDGQIALSPLFDFAPMFHDPEGIPRATVWDKGLEPFPGLPDWVAIGRVLGELLGDVAGSLCFLGGLGEAVRQLPRVAQQYGLEEVILEGVADRCAEIATGLEKVAAEVCF